MEIKTENKKLYCKNSVIKKIRDKYSVNNDNIVACSTYKNSLKNVLDYDYAKSDEQEKEEETEFKIVKMPLFPWCTVNYWDFDLEKNEFIEVPVEYNLQTVQELKEAHAANVWKTEIPIDNDHDFSEAYGWILPGAENIFAEADGAYCYAELNKEGIEAIKNKTYKYTSTVIMRDLEDDEGKVYKTSLIGLTLTNYPRCTSKNMKSIQEVAILNSLKKSAKIENVEKIESEEKSIMNDNQEVLASEIETLGLETAEIKTEEVQQEEPEVSEDVESEVVQNAIGTIDAMQNQFNEMKNSIQKLENELANKEKALKNAKLKEKYQTLVFRNAKGNEVTGKFSGEVLENAVKIAEKMKENEEAEFFAFLNSLPQVQTPEIGRATPATRTSEESIEKPSTLLTNEVKNAINNPGTSYEEVEKMLKNKMFKK